MRRKIDIVSFTRARRAERQAALASGDVTSLINEINTLQSQFADLVEIVVEQGAEITALQEAFNLHKHNYTDIDQSGAVQNKQTDIPS